MFSASRSRGLMLVPIVQSITGQLQKNYGREGSRIIVDNCQVLISTDLPHQPDGGGTVKALGNSHGDERLHQPGKERPIPEPADDRAAPRDVPTS